MSSLLILQITGVDSAGFLHKQLSNDIESLLIGQTRRAYYCSAKGRAQAFLLVHKHATDDYKILCHRDGSDALVKRLRMFVLRDKVDIEIQDQELSIEAPSLWQDCGFVIGPAAQAGNDDKIITAAIKAELPFLPAAAQDAHIPQSLNGDLDGSVDFKTGCYPGQEIIARTHYLGKVKRRMFVLNSALTLKSGDPVLYEDKVIGHIVLAADTLALATLLVADHRQALTCGGQPLQLQPPTLAIPELETE